VSKVLVKWVIATLPVLFMVFNAYAKPLDYERRTPAVDVVEKMAPSVIAIRSDVRRTIVNPFEGLFGFQGLGGFPQEKVYTSAGSGVIIDTNGIVVTNAHVVANANRLVGTDFAGETFELSLIGLDRDFDLAVLQLEDQKTDGTRPVHPDIDWGTTRDLMIGEPVVVIGSALAFENSVSIGIISGVERTVRVPDREAPYFGMIQSDAAINRGNSGGPLVNIRGELIGVTTLIATEGGGSDGIGFAIPVERVSQVFKEFIQGQLSLEEQVGINYVGPKTFENISQTHVDRLGLKENRIQGLLLLNLDERGLGYQAGLRVDDLLTTINGQPVPDLPTYQ
jgi:S1-C subfamily serine protease